MGNKKGHRQFKSLRHQLHNGEEHFAGYPHRRHRKALFKRSEIRNIKETDHLESLEEEVKEIL